MFVSIESITVPKFQHAQGSVSFPSDLDLVTDMTRIELSFKEYARSVYNVMRYRPGRKAYEWEFNKCGLALEDFKSDGRIQFTDTNTHMEYMLCCGSLSETEEEILDDLRDAWDRRSNIEATLDDYVEHIRDWLFLFLESSFACEVKERYHRLTRGLEALSCPKHR